ncbi:MAG: hypothetical protein DMC57_01715 [Verrucomicrobia bacterium]|nr:MAG: hypothetical protein DMC57_01715 [Verrucomicrobiota bacterium]
MTAVSVSHNSRGAPGCRGARASRVLAIASRDRGLSGKIVSARRRKSEPDWHCTRDACATQNQIRTYNIVPMWRVFQSAEFAAKP